MKNKKFLIAAAFVAIVGVSLSACGGGAAMLPNVSGKAGEVIVVVDKNDWEGSLGTVTKEILAKDYPFLPQPEPTFSLSTVPVNGFADLFKPHRNILIFNINPSAPSGVLYKKDEWAHPQCVIQVTAPSSDSAATMMKIHGEHIVNAIEQAERDRVIANSIRYEEHSIPPAVKELTGGSPHFPTGYKLRKKTSDFLWIADDKQYVTQGVFVYKYPAAASDNFTDEVLLAKRNEILKNNVPGMFDNTYMITSEAIKPEVKFVSYRKRQFVEIRGLWEVYNDFMGGPFVSHAFYSKDGKDIIVLDGFVYAPKYDKRQYLRQVESILYSFEWEKEGESAAPGE